MKEINFAERPKVKHFRIDDVSEQDIKGKSLRK